MARNIFSRGVWPLLVLGLFASPSAGSQQLSLTALELSYGPLGPCCPAQSAFPGETITCRFLMAGIELDQDREMDVGLTCRLLDVEGKSILAETAPLAGLVWLDTAHLANFVDIRLPDQLTPGPYELELTLTDNVAGTQTTSKHSIDVLKPRLALVSARFYYDRVGAVVAPCGGVLGQVLYFQIEAIGEERLDTGCDLEFSLEVLDDERRPISYFRPVICHLTAPEYLADRSKHPLFSGNLSLLRPGSFTLRITAEDRHAQAKSDFEIPLVVAQPTAARGDTGRLADGADRANAPPTKR